MELLVALFGIGASIWLIPLIRSGRLVVLAMSVLGLGTVFGPEFFAIDGPIQISADRLIWLLMLVVAVAGWRLGFTRIPKLTRTDWLLAGILGWCLISAISGEASSTGSSSMARWLFYLAMPAGMYAIARMVRVREQDIRWLMLGSIGLGGYLAVTAVFEISGLHSFVFPHYITDPEHWDFYGRARGPLMNPPGNGFLLSISLIASVLALIHAQRRGKVLYAAITLVLLAGVYATLTRSVWLGAAASIGLIGLVFTTRTVRILAVACVVLVGGLSMIGLKEDLMRLKRDKHLSGSDSEKSIQLRPLLAVVAWEMFQDHPIKGHGYGRYYDRSQTYHSDRSYGLPLEEARFYTQHNVFLSLLVDTGLVGLAMAMAWLTSLFGMGWRMAREMPAAPAKRWIGLWIMGTITAYVCNGMFHDVMVIPMVHMFLFLLAGFTVTLAQEGVLAAKDARVRAPNRPERGNAISVPC
ncbi:MAG: O-antigen ligase family protein [Planctomycetota bacterium]